MSDVVGLLDVQNHDTRIDQLHHRRATLPEHDRLTVLADDRRRLEQEHLEVVQQRDELAREQRRLEDEVAAIDEKRRSVDKTMYSGSVANPRELQGMAEEVTSLGRRQSQLEDQVLDLMERIEPLTARITDFDVATAANAADTGSVDIALRAAEADILAELHIETAARAAAVASVPPELVEEYESLRVRAGGIGVARLVGSQCGGCHLTLSAVGLARIKRLSTDSVAHCEECGRLLVH